MNKSDFSTIYNIPEEISGLGFISHFIGFCLLPALIICAIPCVLIDDTWIKDSIELLISSGFLVTLSWIFILIICPVYFFIRSAMELYRYKKCKHKFYSTPNIEYIQLNDDEIFLKNTCPNHDFTIRKQDIINVIIDGEIKSVSHLKATGTPGTVTYIKNLTLTIKTAKESYTIYPQIKSKNLSKEKLMLDEIELLKEQIAFYKNYFENVDVMFDFAGADNFTESISIVKAYELENGASKKSSNYFDIIYKIILIAVFIYFIYYKFFVLE